jgi:hypothetical protein
MRAACDLRKRETLRKKTKRETKFFALGHSRNIRISGRGQQRVIGSLDHCLVSACASSMRIVKVLPESSSR